MAWLIKRQNDSLIAHRWWSWWLWRKLDKTFWKVSDHRSSANYITWSTFYVVDFIIYIQSWFYWRVRLLLLLMNSKFCYWPFHSFLFLFNSSTALLLRQNMQVESGPIHCPIHSASIFGDVRNSTKWFLGKSSKKKFRSMKVGYR